MDQGQHVLKFGTKIRYYSWLGTDSKDYMGLWNFNGQNTRESRRARTGTGDSLCGLDAWPPRPAPIAGILPIRSAGTTLRGTSLLQDDIKVTPRLTLNLGLRYEYTPWPQRLPRPDRHLRRHAGTADYCRERDQGIDLDAQPAARVAYGYLKDLIQTSQRGRAAILDHRSGQEPVGAAIRLRVAALRRDYSAARRLRDLLSKASIRTAA